MGTFEAFRNAPGPTLYRTRSIDEYHQTFDLNFSAILCVIFLLVAIGAFALLGSEQVKKLVFLVISIMVGSSVVLSIISKDWKSSKCHSMVHYRAHSNDRYNVTIELNIGLQAFNATIIDEAHTFLYNEEFYFDRVRKQRGMYKMATEKGLPFPILAITEFMSEDTSGFRWGRYYRLSGHYTHFLLWLSFGLWALACLQYCASVGYATVTTILAGATQFLAIITYVLLQPTQLIIPFSDNMLIIHQWRFGYAFWWIVGNGFLCMMLGILLYTLHCFYPKEISHFVCLKDIATPTEDDDSTPTDCTNENMYENTCAMPMNVGDHYRGREYNGIPDAYDNPAYLNLEDKFRSI